jgi:CBS domain-containing protein
MQIRDIMTKDAQWIDPDMSLAEAAKTMRKHDFGALPVGENDRLVGMVTDRDIVIGAIAEGLDPSHTHVRDVMTQGVRYCFDDEDVETAATQMADHQVRRLPVLNRDKRLVGLVSLADLCFRHDGHAAMALKGISQPGEHGARPH